MRTRTITPGDLVLVDRRGRRFLAEVSDVGGDQLAIRPIDNRVNYFTARAREVVTHWRRVGPPAPRRRGACQIPQLELQAELELLDSRGLR